MPLTIPGCVGYWPMDDGSHDVTFDDAHTGIIRNRVAGGPDGQAYTGDTCTFQADARPILGAMPLSVQAAAAAAAGNPWYYYANDRVVA